MPVIVDCSKVARARAAREHTVEKAWCTPCDCGLRDASFWQPVSHGETCQEPQAVYGLACPRVTS